MPFTQHLEPWGLLRSLGPQVGDKFAKAGVTPKEFARHAVDQVHIAKFQRPADSDRFDSVELLDLSGRGVGQLIEIDIDGINLKRRLCLASADQ